MMEVEEMNLFTCHFFHGVGVGVEKEMSYCNTYLLTYLPCRTLSLELLKYLVLT